MIFELEKGEANDGSLQLITNGKTLKKKLGEIKKISD